MRVGALQLQLGVVGALFHARDVHAHELRAQPHDEDAHQIVGEGTRPLHVVHVEHDGLRLGLADPDGQQPRAVLLLEDDDVRTGRAIEPEPGYEDFDHDEFYPIGARGSRRPDRADSYRSARAARLSAAALSVRSHVKSVPAVLPLPTFSGVRPKWPYADVAL